MLRADDGISKRCGTTHRARLTIEHESVSAEQRQDQLREQAFARVATNALGEKDRAALLLRAEGLDSHEIAAATANGATRSTTTRSWRCRSIHAPRSR